MEKSTENYLKLPLNDISSMQPKRQNRIKYQI